MSNIVADDAQSDAASSLADSLLSSATTSATSYLSDPISITTGSDWDDMITPRVRLDETTQVFVYAPAPGIVREEIHRRRRRHITVRRTRKGHSHIYERGLTRDFFLIITLCFVAACFLICLIRPHTLFWIAEAIQ